MRIGIDLGGTKTEVIALSDQGEQLFRHRLPTPREDYRQTMRDHRHSGGDGRAGDRTAGYRGMWHSWLNFALYRVW
ncbi:ROK family protein [Klebsiella pneumoniae subsp. pneumoniae]|nr:ROK family protein [Klebsiella pneumoniae subsp. pneumoniae]